MSESIILHRENAIGVVTLNAPDTGNAIDQAFCDRLLALAHELEADDTIRCVLVEGRGRFFCVGGDILEFAGAHDLARFTRELTGPLHMAVARLASLEKPLVTAVNGSAAGAGLGLAISGDVALAAETASFSVAYPGIGLSPDAATSFYLPRLIGLRRAQEMAFLGKRVAAKEAEEIGLITRCVPDDALGAEARSTAAKLAAMPTRAIGRTRRLLLDSLGRTIETQLEREADAIAQCAGEPHAKEGITAFIERREARFA